MDGLHQLVMDRPHQFAVGCTHRLILHGPLRLLMDGPDPLVMVDVEYRFTPRFLWMDHLHQLLRTVGYGWVLRFG